MHELTSEDLENIVADLHQRYGDVFSRNRVIKEVNRAADALVPISKHPEFLGILIEKQARSALRARAKKRGESLHKIPEILFLCVHNEGRSPIAAAYAEHLGGDHVFVRSAGTQPTGAVNEVVAQVMQERGVPIHDFPTALQGDVRHVPDFVVHLGEQIPDVAGTRQLMWPVRDPHGQPIEVVREIADDIESRVRDLLQSLDVPSNDAVHSTDAVPTHDAGAHE